MNPEFFGVTVRISKNELEEILGVADCERTNGSTKDWVGTTPEGYVYKVYDFNFDPSFGADDLVEYPIGGYNLEETLKARNYLQTMVLKNMII